METRKIRFEFAHVGINAQTPEEGAQLKNFLTDVLGYGNYRETPVAFFTSDSKMELMKINGRGTMGHLGFFVDDMQEAIRYMESLGYPMEWESAQYGPDGKSITLIFLQDEINGFRIHLSVKQFPSYAEPGE